MRAVCSLFVDCLAGMQQFILGNRYQNEGIRLLSLVSYTNTSQSVTYISHPRY